MNPWYADPWYCSQCGARLQEETDGDDLWHACPNPDCPEGGNAGAGVVMSDDILGK